MERCITLPLMITVTRYPYRSVFRLHPCRPSAECLISRFPSHNTRLAEEIQGGRREKDSQSYAYRVSLVGRGWGGGEGNGAN